ncbi:hypothetical protein K7X08_034331 [Anisodus acutangulus]|uniref:Ribulose bisphosphate carboxylase large subunit C-terminal domain-containing protein n=1 Tax=Anisodus acutangulus TaxID=402998 RepID=A0A9Q1LGS6_9SOLA|nr:hypothetical protein K7X08_034331 [Anisodus acutangulus]
MQTAALWLSPLLVAGAAGGMWAYKKHRQKTNVHIMALNLVRGIPLTAKEKETMLDVLTPPPRGASIKGHYLNATASICKEMIKRVVFDNELGVPIIMHDYLKWGFTESTSLAHYCRDNDLLLHLHCAMHVAIDRQKNQQTAK